MTGGPQANGDLIGHGAAEARWLDAWTGGRLAHAWLLTGPAGIGKATLAYRIARFVLAQGGEGEAAGLFGPAPPPDSLELDPDHPVARRVAAGSHPDLRAVVRSVNPKTDRLRSEIVVDDVRGAVDFLHRTATEGGWRVVIVDPADDMNVNAANALLKILEEPPPRTLLLLPCHNPGRLLPTILSRCRRLALQPLGPADCVEVIRRQQPDLPAEEADILARLADGSPGRALALADAGGLELYRTLIGLVGALPALDIAQLHRQADSLGRGAEGEAKFQTLVGLLQWWLQRLIRARAAGTVPEPVIAEEAEVLPRLAGAGTLDPWMDVWEKIGSLAGQAEGLNLDRGLILIQCFTALAEAAGRPS